MGWQKSHFSQRGVGLIEILIALLVLSIGLLGMSALQINATKQSHSLMLRTQAINLAYDIADRLRVNRTQALTDGYLVPIGNSATQVDQAASGIAKQDLAQLFTKVSALPSGDFSIGPAVQVGTQGARRFAVQVCWLDPYRSDNTFVRVDGSGANQCGSAGLSSFSFMAGL